MPGLQPLLIVDDNHDDLFILKRLLLRAGAKNALVTFDHSEEAIRFLQAAIRTPDTNMIPAAIFSDIRMPGVDGFDFLQWVRQQPAMRGIPFYLFTSSDVTECAGKAESLGVTQLYAKFPPAHVLGDLFTKSGGKLQRG